MKKEKRNLPIAVFDSGVGGISVVRALRRHLPLESILYFGDSAGAPYGEKDPEWVREAVLFHCEALLSEAKALVLACNTATALTAGELRRRHPDVPIVGMEPALKPALSVCPHPTVLLLATANTLSAAGYQNGVKRVGKSATVIPLTAPRLVTFAEAGEIKSPTVQEYIRELLAPHLTPPPDAVVLGCTHFPFFADTVRETVGAGVPLFDGVDATVRELGRRLSREMLSCTRPQRGTLTLRSSRAASLPLFLTLGDFGAPYEDEYAT